MKSIKLIILAISLTILSCEKDSEKENENKSILTDLTELKSENGISYSESLNKWSQLKEQNGNSYIYQTTIGSWTGNSITTELKIENGIVISRICEVSQYSAATGKCDILQSYSESKNQIGTHDYGAEALTIDALYTSCAGEYLIADTEKNSVYFETEAEGLLITCGYIPNNCADDCFNGIKINAFKWIN